MSSFLHLRIHMTDILQNVLIISSISSNSYTAFTRLLGTWFCPLKSSTNTTIASNLAQWEGKNSLERASKHVFIYYLFFRHSMVNSSSSWMLASCCLKAAINANTKQGLKKKDEIIHLKNDVLEADNHPQSWKSNINYHTWLSFCLRMEGKRADECFSSPTHH